MSIIKTYQEFLNESEFFSGPKPNKNLPKFDGLDAALKDFSTDGTYVIDFRTDPGYGYQHVKLLQLWIPNVKYKYRGKKTDITHLGGGKYGLAIWDTERKEFIEEPASYDDYEVTVDRMETKYGFEHEIKIQEGFKTWATGLMAALSLFSSTVMGGNIKVSGKGVSKSERTAVQMAKNDAVNQVRTKMGGEGQTKFIMKSGKYTNINVEQDKEGNFIATVDLETDSSDISVTRYEILPAKQAKMFLGDIVGMGYVGADGNTINNFIDKFGSTYNFKISKMNKEQADEVGEHSIKLSKELKNGNTVFCVVTPISE